MRSITTLSKIVSGIWQTLRELVQKAHTLDIKMIQDQVANHVGSQHPWVNDPPLNNWFHGTLAQHISMSFETPCCYHRTRTSSIFATRSTAGSITIFLDMNQEEPEVARYEIQNALWWVGMTGIDGIRQDTIQYMPRFFIRDLSNARYRQYPSCGWLAKSLSAMRRTPRSS